MKDTLDNLVISTIRTAVPAFMGTFFTLLASNGFELDAAAITGGISFVMALCIGAYYLVVRLLAQKFPQLEWLLGAPKAPVYDKGETAL